MNIIDGILIILIAAALVLAIRKTIYDHKQGKNCTGNCSQCYQHCSKKTK